MNSPGIDLSVIVLLSSGHDTNVSLLTNEGLHLVAWRRIRWVDGRRQQRRPGGGKVADEARGVHIPDGRPARFADALADPEFRTLYAATAFSWIGDYIARAAITALVYQSTDSVSLSAAAFAISYAPYLLGGSVLVSLAERYPYRTIMVVCDMVRMLLMTVLTAALLMPDLHLAVVLGLLLACALFSPPFDAARSATLPAVLSGDRYVVGVALFATTSQPVQVVGYLAGATMAAVEPRLALLINAVTFGVSALLVRLGLRWRAPALRLEARTRLLRETADGFRLVFGTPALRGLVLLVFCGSVFAIVPEGLGAAWASKLASEGSRGLAQGWIMAAVPGGAILGALAISRLVAPHRRPQLLGPLAIAGPLALVPALLNPPVPVVVIAAGLCGFAAGGLLPVANGEFVRLLPAQFRARAFGVVSGGLQLLQGGAVLATGALARHFQVASVVGAWSLAGVVAMILLVRPWGPNQPWSTIAARGPTPVIGTRRHSRPATAPGTMDT
jgi:hypothetical protein